MTCTLVYGESGIGKTQWCKSMYKDYTSVFYDTVLLSELNNTITKFKYDSLGGKHSIMSIFKSKCILPIKFAIVIDHADYTKTEVSAINSALRNASNFNVVFVIVVDTHLLDNVKSIRFDNKIDLNMLLTKDQLDTKMLCTIRSLYPNVRTQKYNGVLSLSDCNWWTLHTICSTEQYYSNVYDKYVKGNNEMLTLLFSCTPNTELYNTMDCVINNRTTALLFENALKTLRSKCSVTDYLSVVDTLCDATVYINSTTVNDEEYDEEHEQIDPLFRDLQNWLSVYLPADTVRVTLNNSSIKLTNTDVVNYNTRYSDKQYSSIDIDKELYKYKGVTLMYYECNYSSNGSSEEDDNNVSRSDEEDSSEEDDSTTD